MIPPVIRPSSLPALDCCPRYSPDQSTGETQKSDGTKRHTALGLYLAGDPAWHWNLGEWDADGVAWAGEYIRTQAPLADRPLVIEERATVMLEDFSELSGTPDVRCGHVLFDLKGRDIADYRLQMMAYALMMGHDIVTAHILYATERRAETVTINGSEAFDLVNSIVARAKDPASVPVVCDYCGWCVNRPSCPAFSAVGRQVAQRVGLPIPDGNIEDVRDSAGLRDLKLAADAVGEWAKLANSHVREMAIKGGVIADGFQLLQRKGSPSIRDAWAAVQASGLPVETVAKAFSLSLPDLAAAYAAHHGLKEKAAKADLEIRLGDLIQRGATVQYLKAIN